MENNMKIQHFMNDILYNIENKILELGLMTDLFPSDDAMITLYCDEISLENKKIKVICTFDSDFDPSEIECDESELKNRLSDIFDQYKFSEMISQNKSKFDENAEISFSIVFERS
jgi:hypothetical protein